MGALCVREAGDKEAPEVARGATNRPSADPRAQQMTAPAAAAAANVTMTWYLTDAVTSRRSPRPRDTRDVHGAKIAHPSMAVQA